MILGTNTKWVMMYERQIWEHALCTDVGLAVCTYPSMMQSNTTSVGSD